MGIRKNALEQYESIKLEIEDLEKMIENSYKKIRKYEKMIVSDTVTGTREDLTIGPIKVNGIAQQQIDRENELNEKRIQKLEKFRKKLIKTADETEEYIQSIEDSEIRRISRWRYMEGLEWNQVAVKMGNGYSGTSCRKKMERFLQKNKIVRS